MPPAHAAVGCDVKGNVMTSRPGTIRMQGPATAARAAVGACTLFLVFSALAQEAQSPKSTPVPNPNPAQSPSGPGFFLLPPLPPQPNLVETFGRWLDQGTTKFRTDMQGAQETFDKLGNQTRDAAKDATDAMIGLPNTRIVTGARALHRGAERQPRLPVGGRCILPRQGIPERKEPRYPVGAEMSCEGLARGPLAQ